MREIKFRVFDKDTKRMHVCGEDIHDSMTFINNQVCYYNLQNGCGSLPKEHEAEGTYELMQYTGLKDKNSKEIYTRDVVIYTRHIYTDCSRMGIAEKQEPIVGEFCFFEGLWPGFKLRDGSVMVFLPGTISSEEFEIIGTAFENPELLEGTE